jgi:hypothetical protein
VALASVSVGDGVGDIVGLGVGASVGTEYCTATVMFCCADSHVHVPAAVQFALAEVIAFATGATSSDASERFVPLPSE